MQVQSPRTPSNSEELTLMTNRNRIVTVLMADSVSLLTMSYMAAYQSANATLVALAVYILGRDYLLNQKRKRPLRTG